MLYREDPSGWGIHLLRMKNYQTYIHEQTLLIHLWSNGHNIPLTDLPGLDPLNKGYNQ